MTQNKRRISVNFPYDQIDIPMSGREADFTAVKSRLLETDAYQQRLIVLTAVGGTGKTRLAAELAMKLTEFTDGILWVNWRDYNSPNATESDLTTRLRTHLGLPDATEPDEVWAALAESQVLIVLDNAESVPFVHRPDITKRIRQYPTLGGSRVLMTSRIVWDDCKFAYPHSLDILTLPAAEKVVRSMADLNGKADAVAGHETTFAQKAHRHPLLIKYAVGWLSHKHDSLAKVFTMLDTHNNPDIEAMLTDVLHNTLFQIEYGEQEPQAVADFKRLLVCKGGFTENSANALIGEDSPSLGILRRWNLLGQTSDRYTIDPLAEAALEADETAYPLHLDFYEALARQHNTTQDYFGLDIESDNLATAFDWAMRVSEYEKAYWLHLACHFFLANRGRFDLRKIWLESVTEKLESHPDESLKATVQNSLGLVYQELPTGNRHDNLRRAIVCYQKALEYRTPHAAPLDYAMTQNNLGNTYGNLSAIEDPADNLQQAIDCYQAALGHYTPQAAPLDYAMTQHNLAAAYRNLSEIQDRAENLRQAIDCYQAALEHYIPQAAPLDYAMTQNNLGIAYWKLSAIEDRADSLRRAIECYQQALVYWTPKAAPLNYAGIQQNLGLLYQDLDETEKQCSAWHEAEKYFRLMGFIDNADDLVQELARLGC